MIATYKVYAQPTAALDPYLLWYYADPKHATAAMLDYVYGANGFCAWVEDESGRLVAHVPPGQARHAGADPCHECEGEGFVTESDSYGVYGWQDYARACDACGGDGIALHDPLTCDALPCRECATAHGEPPRCGTCVGSGRVPTAHTYAGSRERIAYAPCPDCGGSGIATAHGEAA